MSDLENALKGKSVAILVANGFEESHMTSLHKSLVLTGADVKIVSPAWERLGTLLPGKCASGYIHVPSL